MSSADSNHKNIVAKPRKKRSLKATPGLDPLPELLKQELTATKEVKKTSLRVRKNHNNTATVTDNSNSNNNNDNDSQAEKASSRKRSIRASSKAIVQRTEQSQTDDLLEQVTIAQTVEETAVEQATKKPRRKRKLKPQNNPIPNSTLLSGDELALEGHEDSGLSVYLNNSSSQPTPVTLGTPQKKRRITSKFRTPSPPPSQSQSPPSTPSRLALSTVLSDLDLSKHTILPDHSYVAHMRDGKDQSDSDMNEEGDVNHDEVQSLLFDTFQARNMEEEEEDESDASSIYFDAMSDIEENEKTTFTDEL